jgi:excinuclease ABC subunit C
VEDLTSSDSVDLVGFCFADQEVDLSIYMIRQGVLVAMKHFNWLSMNEDEVSEQLLQYYQDHLSLPDKIYIPLPKEELLQLEISLQKILKKKIQLMPESRKFLNLMKQVQDHASQAQRIRLETKKALVPALEELKTLVGMSTLPLRMECFDVAIWQGKSPTASQVVFTDGRSDKGEYRYYHLSEREEGNNDYAMLGEAIGRRLKSSRLPDLWIIDGGKGQLNVAQKLLRDVPTFVCALAKEKSGTALKERLFLPGHSDAIDLDEFPLAKKILVQMRDEAHRFSRKLHHHAEKQRVIKG